ncbi:protein EFR3 homolog cmp44E isoform X2 [Bemisia tabaci]|uniref:protein EFR3 homolog cmp44E isoform X2 n=1 Tax=Bemisia tabaci TaxID=7038 RepID=UPI0008F9C74C|nr:PREDICTED: protein EFR3 homolog cmp44E isoform X2 [Bemisia tabaci]
MCCGCFGMGTPRYKHLVDHIYPNSPQEGLVKNNMEKLAFYAISSPEKLDRIGEYLLEKASRDISRRRYGFVKIAMEAMDQLLQACHAQSLNLFVESFLRTVQKLLESSEPELQILATQSFVKFANIEEDTPSYHRRYDFFVSKFSSMCHSNHPSPETLTQLRVAGINGLQGVIRKTVSDDLVENIWESIHMDKIVPSLLYNMQDSRYEKDSENHEPIVDDCDIDPPSSAETVFRELVGRAGFGHVDSVIKPVLRHLDLHGLWLPNTFAVHVFKILMFSIQSQYTYTVVESLIIHLDKNSKTAIKIRTSIAEVLAKIIAIAASDSVGPTVLEIINSLLAHLRTSAGRQRPTGHEQDEEQLYQDALIHALGEFAAHLPNYQKIEIMMFIMSKVPSASGGNRNLAEKDIVLQRICLQSLLMVSTKYNSVQMTQTFPQSFLEPLLKMVTAADCDIRLLIFRILHTLLDRHDNYCRLTKPTTDVNNLDLVLVSCSRQDAIFMHKFGREFYISLYESLELENNDVDNIEAIYSTLALLLVELYSEEMVLDFLIFILTIQDLALTSTLLSESQMYNLHILVISLFALIPKIIPLPLKDYADKIIETRSSTSAFHLLPPMEEMHTVKSETPVPNGCLLEQSQLIEILQSAGVDAARLSSSPSMLPGATSLGHRHSWVESAAAMKGSVTDIHSNLDSGSSTPGIQRKYPNEDLTFEAMKRIISENPDAKREREAERQNQLYETFRTTSFNELVTKNIIDDEETLQATINEIFSKLNADSRIISPSSESRLAVTSPQGQKPMYELLFPELFSY